MTRAGGGPLAGVRVVDMTSVMMGPYATLALADYGADVIKVESPTGDTTRQITPMRNPRMGPVFLHLNRSKRSVVLDLKKPEAAEAFLKIIETADVFISNVRPRALGRLGLSPDVLAERNPRLVIASLVGFGQDGPYAADPAYEDLIQGLTAVPSLLVQAGSDKPHYVPLSFSDRSVGTSAAVAILAALLNRERTGKGERIEVPMFEVMAHANLSDHMSGLTFEPPNGPPGYKRTLNPERRPFRTNDGYVCAIIYTDKHWRNFAELIGRPNLMEEDARFASIGARTDHSEEGYRLISDYMVTRSTAEWLEALRAADIPVAPLHTLESIMEDPHLMATGFFETIEHPTEGKLVDMAVPVKFAEAQLPATRPAPRLGQDTAQVLEEAGVDAETIAAILAGNPAESQVA